MMEVLPTMPTTWSVWTSCLASAAIVAGLVCSVSMYSLIGWPLMPPLALTQAKYALAMFGMSVNEVPGWLVAMAPSAIGVPAAATPGLVPHCDVLTAEVLAELVAVLVGVLAGALVELELEPLELELLQPAAAIAMAAARTTVLRAERICAFISPPLRW